MDVAAQRETGMSEYYKVSLGLIIFMGELILVKRMLSNLVGHIVC